MLKKNIHNNNNNNNSELLINFLYLSLIALRFQSGVLGFWGFGEIGRAHV